MPKEERIFGHPLCKFAMFLIGKLVHNFDDIDILFWHLIPTHFNYRIDSLKTT